MTGDPTVSHSSNSRVGSRFGPYLLRKLLGSGGFGEVYEAEDTVMHRVVALKLLSSSYSHNPAFRERLFREARTAGRLHDPHVVPIHGCGEIDGQLYIDMRLIDGTDLQSVLDRNGAMPAARAVAIVRQIAAALDAAHAETVIHRDVKPANILLGRDDFACLVDFGLANAATDTKLTSEGTTVGSFAYLAPERLASGQITVGADIYALACVLHECLTGESPYGNRGEIPALVAAHLAAPPPRPSQQRPGIPVGFDEVIALGMAKDPEQRYRTAGELGAAAQRALETPVPERVWAPPAPVTQPWKHPQPAPIRHPVPPVRRRSRRRAALTVAGISLLAVLAVVLAFVVTPKSTRHPGATSSAQSTPTAPSSASVPPLNADRLPVIGRSELGGVAVGANGDVYVVDTATAVIYKLPLNSAAPVEVPFPGLTAPKRLAVDAAGAVYIADWPQGGPSRIWKLPPGAAAPAELPFGRVNARGIAVDADGNVYVADREEVLQLAPNAATPTVLPFGGGSFEDVAVDSAGAVYGLQRGRLLKLARGSASPAQLPFGPLGTAEAAAVDGKGNIYVVDNAEGMGRLLKLAVGADAATLLAAPENKPFGDVAVDAAGNIYLTQSTRLLKVTAG
ncbi:hypothetical protein A5634_24035 [Mycobacterium asiaticum]|uniref:non-specific serine/threonine protein kinase n=1 Tax=Mycobacterium asiaticum TaxID=1790 RepID=A0A1A3P358_MYCAS|nr:serine/threonine-protein kinase [Mycobacterium asiaticum]OBK27017.1 hypothetical protein A5634_24035 [Mycobacterium asiaticum]